MTQISNARAHVDAFRWADTCDGEQRATLSDMAAIRRAADEMIRATVRDMRTYGNRRGEASWRSIGEALGVSMQAAQQRYGRPDA